MEPDIVRYGLLVFYMSCVFDAIVHSNVPALYGEREGRFRLFFDPVLCKLFPFFQDSDTKRSSSELCPQAEFILHQHALQNELNDLQQASM